MNRYHKKRGVSSICCLISSLLVVFASVGSAQEASNENNQRESRIDFGNSMIMGQSIKSGAVYLTNRKKSEIKSILKKRESYRDEILSGFKAEDEKNKNR